MRSKKYALPQKDAPLQVCSKKVGGAGEGVRSFIGGLAGNSYLYLKMPLLEIGPVIFGSKEGLIDYFRRHHLLASYIIVMRMREKWAHDFRCPTHTSRDFLCHAHSFPCAKSEVPFLPNDPRRGQRSESVNTETYGTFTICVQNRGI